MSAGKYDITIEQGSDWIRTLTVEDDGVARDLTGYTIRLQVREKYYKDELFLSISTDSGEIAITDATNGIFTITLDAETTAGLEVVKNYDYDLELEDGNGVVTRLLEGKFEVSGEVTR